MIRKTTKGYVVKSKTTGRKLGGPYPTKKQAETRQHQVEMFKHMKPKK